MKRPPLPYLLLLPLLAVLLFGNCGGGVREVVNGLSNERHERLRAIILRQRAERAAARQLHGEARWEAYEHIEEKTTARADSLLGAYGNGRNKFRKRRNKLERQVLRKNNSALIPAIRFNINTR